MPIKVIEDGDHPGLQYLEEAKNILEEWKQTGNAGLTHETFSACIQTMGALPELAKYLLERHNFQYVLSGKLMSDPLEGRFGWYRQVNGGNFFMSVHQLLLAEKKIRCLSLLQKDALLTASTIHSEMRVVAPEENGQTCDSIWLSDFLSTVALDDSHSEAAVTYFVSGYIGRSVSRLRKCSSCRDLLVASNDCPELQQSVPEEHRKIFEMADRGGLSVPSELCFAVTEVAVQYFTAIAADESVMQKLFASSNQRSLFIKATVTAASCNDTLCTLTDVKCAFSHANFELIVKSAFNCFAKNHLKRLNSRPCPEDPQPKVLRKIRKLTSKASS